MKLFKVERLGMESFYLVFAEDVKHAQDILAVYFRWKFPEHVFQEITKSDSFFVESQGLKQ